jgi:hypothetical protein
MVVMAFLGAGMVYLTTTSTFQELFANNHARAYYAAESGGRYANALIRQSLAGGTALGTSLPTELVGQFTMGNGNQVTSFQFTNWVHTSVNVGAGITNYYYYDSIGTVGSGFLQAKRKISYKIHPADQSTLPVPPPIPSDASEFNKPSGGGDDATFLQQYFDPAINQETKIFVVTEDGRAGGDQALNLAAYDWIIGLKWYWNAAMAQLDSIRAANSNLLSYGAQIKIYDSDEDDNNFKPSLYNIFGISFRLDDYATATSTATLDNNYLISFVKLTKPATAGPGFKPDWYINYIYTNPAWDVFSTDPNAPVDGQWFIVLWKMIYIGGNWSYSPIAYHKLTSADSVCRAGFGSATYCTKIKPWSTLMVCIEEKSSAPYNEITGYIASQATYPRRTVTPYNLNSQPIIWAEKDGDTNTNTVPSIFQQISWTKYWDLWEPSKTYAVNDKVNVNSDGDAYICIADHTSTANNKPGTGANWTTSWQKLSQISLIQDSSLTTANYVNDDIGIIKTKARELGLHIFYDDTNAKDIWYDNFYIDLSPSGYGYVPGSGQVTTGP